MAETLGTRRLGVTSSEASVYLSSSDDFDYACSTCKTNGNNIEAVGYCVECVEYLCVSCIDHHFKNTQLTAHILLHLHRITDVSDVQNQGQPQSTEDKSSDFDYSDDLDNLTFLKGVNVKAGSDKEDCRIVAIVALSNNILVVADADNNSVKVMDDSNDRVSDTLKLPCNPLSLTRLPDDQLAVTLGDHYCIKILSTKRALKVVKTIRMDGFCHDVAYFNGKLLVSLEDPLMFQVLDMKGKVLDRIVPGQDVTSLCTIPRFIALSPDEKTIFISDWENKICLSMDMKGKKISECKEFGQPGRIVCSPTLPYNIVCDKDRHVVRKLTMDLECCDIFLNKSDGLKFPQALCLCPKQRYLIVSSDSAETERCNRIMIFQF